MSYIQAKDKAYKDISNLTKEIKFSVGLLSDVYDVDLEKESIFSSSCNVPAKEHVSILILHYLIQKLKLKILPQPAGEWINFKELEGGDGYYPAFKKRTIDVILKKYGTRPEALLDAAERFGAKRAQAGDIGIILEPFEGVPILIEIFRGDEEFPPDANIVFDKNISKIFCTEDVVVLTEFIAHML